MLVDEAIVLPIGKCDRQDIYRDLLRREPLRHAGGLDHSGLPLLA